MPPDQNDHPLGDEFVSSLNEEELQWLCRFIEHVAGENWLGPATLPNVRREFVIGVMHGVIPHAAGEAAEIAKQICSKLEQ